MQFYKSNDVNCLNKKLHTTKKDKFIKLNNLVWIISLTVFSFLLSLVLSLFSEIFLEANNIILAIFLLLIFMSFNIVSDMIGLAITSCQVIKIKKSNLKQKEKVISIYLIKNSDKVSSILCDVIGDVCSILCGASASILALIISTKLQLSIIYTGCLINSIVVCLTVLIKAITKNYAIKNSLKIVRVCSKIILKIKNSKLYD